MIDAIGFLSSVYQYGTVALIGGGFNNGIHNILEPTVYGLPVMFGPNYDKFNEAYQMIDLKAGFVFNTTNDLTIVLNLFLRDAAELANTSRLAKNYVRKNSGATSLIVKDISTYF